MRKNHHLFHYQTSHLNFVIEPRPMSPKMVSNEETTSVGLELVWSRDGSWAGVAGTTGPTALFALEGLGRFVRLNEKGEELEASEADENRQVHSHRKAGP